MVGVKQLEDDHLLAKSKQSKLPQFLEGIKVPLYHFGSQSLMDHKSFGEVSCISEDGDSILDTLLLSQWEDRVMKGIFRYDVTASEIKAVEGRKKFLAQLNEEWISDHFPKPGENETTFYQEDVFPFNFMKQHDELLFCVASSEQTNPELISSAVLPDNAFLIFINASPVEYGHVLLVPYLSNSFYQLLDANILEMAVRVAVEINNCCFRLFYDFSPDASHLHFQACYFPNPLAVELMPVDTIFGDLQSWMHISVVTDYSIKTLLLESNQKFKIMMEVLVNICYCLQELSILYSLLISDCGKKIFLFLQKSKDSSSLSAWECGGYFMYKSRSEFDECTEKTILKRLSSVSIDDDGFKAVKLLCCSIASKFGV
ncbi:GDP-L-galactose phosphorylase 1-like [Humulus lupulus]|uniref:GDP-L-galactose phosphorylase 1-like n=1 Tax=Humulus lupulus TaxID=3486 RepID=UPI002B403B13|nr:GDP-L-galactose phosphorylase 1-like [Humulus lupulus]XP_062096654.1 GDP-L-galactose phosphorylase 1-like [Humulus lupulus]